METVEMELDPEAARRYREAGPDERARAQTLLGLWLRHPMSRQEAAARLRETMDRASREAEARGLTPEILAEMLVDE